MASSSKKHKTGPNQEGKEKKELKVKFLINIPVKVEKEDQGRRRCGYLLTKLNEDISKSKVNTIDDVAIIFGLNGKYSEGLRIELNNLATRLDHEIKHSIITFTWGDQGDIAKGAKEPPFQHIREHLKNHDETKRLVRKMKEEDPTAVVYFSFVDSDTIRFNRIYEEYFDIVKHELDKNNILPTVMSTGYEFDKGSEFHPASHFDRMVRITTAEKFPLCTYYPEPNFCVLVPKDKDHIPESFINPSRTNMESPILISQLKHRKDFKAVFPDRNPIIIDVPERFKLCVRDLQTNQSHLGARTWAISAYVHGELKNKESIRGIVGRNRKYLTDLLTCDDATFKDRCERNPFEGEYATALLMAAEETREYKKVIEEIEKKLPIKGTSSK